MSVCHFFLKPCENPPNLQDLKNRISGGSIDEKVVALKELIKCLVSDETFPPIIMHIITNLIPAQHKSQSLRKAMLLYWQVIEKSKSPTDKSLKEEVFLACNSLRNDLIGHNEYLRGRTLRMISRIMHRGVIEPLATAITNNLQHKSAYVRRNAVVCLYSIFLSFGADIVGEIDDEIEELLKKETDLSTKRNAFLLLNKSNPQKAMQYIQTQIKNQSVDEIGDILQLSILKILKQKCKEDPSQKPRLLKIVNDFQEKATQSVRLECAITSTAISNSASTIKSSLASYVNILAKTNQINVKKIILDKLQIICKNSNYLEEDVVEDLIKGFNTPSIEIKIKIIEIVMMSISVKSSQIILRYLEKENLEETTSQCISKVLSLLQLITYKFTSVHEHLADFFAEKVFSLKDFLPSAVLSLNNIIKLLLKNPDRKFQKQFQNHLIHSFNRIASPDLLKIVINELGLSLSEQKQIKLTIDQLKKAIGQLPLEAVVKQHFGEPAKEEAQEKRVFKTVIQEDGSYQSQLVVKKKDRNAEIQNQLKNNFRNFLINDSIFGGVFARSTSKLLYKIRKASGFNKYACSLLMILCSLLRHYQSNSNFVDQAIIDQITVIIRKIVNPQKFSTTDDALFTSYDEQPLDFTFNDKKVQMIQKDPGDLIHFRLLKKGQDTSEFDFDEQEVNDIMEQSTQKIDYITKLKSIVQLTGSFDPLYSEAFVRVNKYDLFFEILLINNTKYNLLNIQIEFSSNVQVMVLQRAQSVNLRPFQSSFLRAQLRFTDSQFGVVYGYINYDNHAGLQQPYLITEEINIDYMQFLEPAAINQTNFKLEWQKAEHEIVYETIIPLKKNRNFNKIIQTYEKLLHSRLVENPKQNQTQYFYNCHLFGKSKLGENYYINLALFSGDEINLSATIRSRDKAVRDIIYKQLIKHKFTDDEEEES